MVGRLVKDAGMQLMSAPHVLSDVGAGPANGRAFDAEGEDDMEFLVEFELEIPDGIQASDVGLHDVAVAAERLADQGRLVRLWNVPSGLEEDRILALYRSKDLNELDDILDNLPFNELVNVVITRLEPHPNDPYRGET
jgi:muconolactone delta-isomerase